MRTVVLFAALAGVAGCSTAPSASVPRLSAEEVRRKTSAPEGTIFVCAYDSPDCRGLHLEGSISYEDLLKRLSTLKPTSTIIFYCGCVKDRTAVERAEYFARKGYTSVYVLEGGLLAWMYAGYPAEKVKSP